MTLRKKTFFILVLTTIILLASLYIYSKLLLLNSFIKVEEQDVRQNVSRVSKALERDISFLDTLAIDYSFWDDTCNFIEYGGDDYLQANMNDLALQDLNVNLVVLMNSSGKIVFEKASNPDMRNEIEIIESFQEHLVKDSPLMNLSKPMSSVKGIVYLSQGPMLVASHPVLTNKVDGFIYGTLIMGRMLDLEDIKRITEETQVFFTLKHWNDSNMMKDELEARSVLSKTGDIYIQEHDEQHIGGYTVLKDIYGDPVMLLHVNMNRDIYQRSLSSINIFILILAVSSLIIGSVSVIVHERLILSRVRNLSGNVSSIGISGDLNARLPIKGNDELTVLASSINVMIESLLNFQLNEERYLNLLSELRTAHQQVKDIIEFLPDPTFVIDSKGKVIAWNKSIEEMTGVGKEEIIGKCNYAYATPFYGYSCPHLIDLISTNDQEIEQLYEHVERRGNRLCAEVFVPSLYGGKGANLWCVASPLYDIDGNLVGAIESIRDITERKKAEEKHKYLSLHDPVTGLYNRMYFENEMLHYSNEDSIFPSIILCDVDGLKVINDGMGHQIGDKLLTSVANILKKSLPEKGVVARIGGDEFAILLLNTDKESPRVCVEKVCNQINEAVEKYNEVNPQIPLSLSLGYAINNGECKCMDLLFKEADDNMYRNKLYHTQSNRSSIIQTLMNALEARDFITEGHADRLEDLLADVGRTIGLSEQKITDLRLLGQFHDLGKVGIPDRILFKAGPLTSEEYSEMKRHTEIGYRIARSAPDLIPIADLILKHHEWWNGEGYPLGLKGEEIPLECRLLGIADAYDAMTNDRPYRKAMSHDEAIIELRKNAGKQFDPYMVEEFIRILEDYRIN